MISRKTLEHFAGQFAAGRLTVIPEFRAALEASQTLVYFDWGSWQAEAARLLASPTSVADLDRETALRLLTFLVRADQYRPGTLSRASSHGTLAPLLRRLARFCE